MLEFNTQSVDTHWLLLVAAYDILFYSSRSTVPCSELYLLIGMYYTHTLALPCPWIAELPLLRATLLTTSVQPVCPISTLVQSQVQLQLVGRLRCER